MIIQSIVKQAAQVYTLLILEFQNVSLFVNLQAFMPILEPTINVFHDAIKVYQQNTESFLRKNVSVFAPMIHIHFLIHSNSHALTIARLAATKMICLTHQTRDVSQIVYHRTGGIIQLDMDNVLEYAQKILLYLVT